MNIITDECLYNILGHLKNAWSYEYPTGKTLESAFFEGIKPFYPDAKKLGSPSTIVDSGKESEGFDIKGSKTLRHIKKKVRSSNDDNNIFVTQTIPETKEKIILKVPKSIVTQVRRPKVDLKKYAGNSEKILKEQITDYQRFADSTTARDGYQTLYSVVSLYGIDKGIKSVFLTFEKFSIPEIATYTTGFKKDGKTPSSYLALNSAGDQVFMLSSFNKGSSNFYKRFPTIGGVAMSWPIEERVSVIYTKEELEKTCAIQKIL